MIESGDPNLAHPAYWAPFVVVGEGSSAEVANVADHHVCCSPGGRPTN
jgi:hypothetical protein